MRGADLAGRRSGPLGHEPFRGWRDRLVLGGHEIPGGDRPPARWAGRLGEGGGVERPLGGGHHCGGVVGDIGAEHLVEDVRSDVRVESAGVGPERQVGRAGLAAGILGEDLGESLTRLGREGRDVDEGFDVGVTGGRVGDRDAAVGVTDEDEGAGDRGEHG